MPLDGRSIALPYADGFPAIAPSLPGHGDRDVRMLREQSIARFRLLGLPTTRVEHWKYTNLKPLVGMNFSAAPAAEKVDPSEICALVAAPVLRMVLVNGRLRRELSEIANLPRGARILSLADALEAGPVGEPSLVPIFDGVDGADALRALNAAFMTDGYILRLDRDTRLETPIEIVHVGRSNGTAVAYHARNVIIAAPGSRVTVVETSVGSAGAAYWSQSVTDVRAGEGAVVHHYRIQDEAPQAINTVATDVRLARDARYESFVLSTGAALSRNEIRVVLDGTGASCKLDGGYLMRRRQHADTTTEIIHARPNTVSSEVYKGVLDDQSRGVFQGRIVVKQDAQKSDGHQMNKTILLSERAEIDTKPELEIYADDVKCSHGAAAGELDEDALFYLRARGIDMPEARRLLVEAFIGDALEGVSDAAIRTLLERQVGRWMVPASLERVT